MRIYLAPMEGVIDYHVRKLYAKTGGVDGFTTEFIRVTDHLLPQKVFLRYCPELLHSATTNRSRYLVRIQLLGSDPNLLAENAHKAASLGAHGIDLNFGCPAKTVNKNRGGACLLNETELLHRIAAAVRRAVPATVPVSAKIRLGYEGRNSYLENATALAAAGISELIVHARSKVDGYHPPAYWKCIGEIRERVKIPLIANGEIWSIGDYQRCRHLSGCADVMLGRGLLARPDLALAIKALHEDTVHREYSWRQAAVLLAQFHFDTKDRYPKKFLGNRVKQWLYYLQHHYPEAGILFEKIKKTRDEFSLSHALQQQIRLNH